MSLTKTRFTLIIILILLVGIVVGGLINDTFGAKETVIIQKKEAKVIFV